MRGRRAGFINNLSAGTKALTYLNGARRTMLLIVVVPTDTKSILWQVTHRTGVNCVTVP